MRLEEERKRQERIQAEKNALYNRQRLDMEAQNIAMNELRNDLSSIEIHN